MKKVILYIFLLGNISLLFSQGTEFITFEHKALSLRIKYPATWKKYWYYDDYSNKDYLDMSRNEIKEMTIKYGYYPPFYIKKYDEIYNGVNPSIKITLRPHYYYFSINDLFMSLYNIENGRLYNFVLIIDQRIDIITSILSEGKTITQKIKVQRIGNKSFLHFITEDYVLDSHIIYESFYRITEYFLYLGEDYIMTIEINYSRTINNNDKNELMEIIKNISIN
jgi:hypothetical protein